MPDSTLLPSRWFGLAVAISAGVLAWTVWRSLHSAALSGAIAFAGVFFAALYGCVPAWRIRLFAAFQTLTFPIRYLATLLVLGVVYYLVLTPIALWFRVSGKSFRKIPDAATSNWNACETDADPERYFRTF